MAANGEEPFRRLTSVEDAPMAWSRYGFVSLTGKWLYQVVC